MKIEFFYPGYESIPSFEVPDENLIGVYRPKSIQELGIHSNEESILTQGLYEPCGAPRLKEAVQSKRRVLILVDDNTRVTPVSRILPQILGELHDAGIEDENIEFLTAPGTHREMKEEELRQKLGASFGRFRIHQHHWLNEAELCEYGVTSDGTRVTASRHLRRFNFILGIGSIVPHRVKGFSGGAKIAFPGVSGREMMERNQWDASLRMSETVMGEAENPMRLRMEEAARLAGLTYIVNVVLDREDKIAGCFVGDLVSAHRNGCKLAREIYAAHLPHRADIVIADSHPADRDLWQSAKGFYSGILAVRRGGSLIVVAPNPEGVAGNHPNLLEIGYRPHPEIVQMVESGKVHDIVGVAILGDISQIVDHADCILVSPGVDRRDAGHLGFRYAESPARALEMAFARQGRDASVAVLQHGGHILPLVEETLPSASESKRARIIAPAVNFDQSQGGAL